MSSKNLMPDSYSFVSINDIKSCASRKYFENNETFPSYKYSIQIVKSGATAACRARNGPTVIVLLSKALASHVSAYSEIVQTSFYSCALF